MGKDNYLKVYGKRLKRFKKEYSGEDATGLNHLIVQDLISKVGPAFSKFITDESIDEHVYEEFHETLNAAIDESYKIGFYFAQHTILENIHLNKHDDF